MIGESSQLLGADQLGIVIRAVFESAADILLPTNIQSTSRLHSERELYTPRRCRLRLALPELTPPAVSSESLDHRAFRYLGQ